MNKAKLGGDLHELIKDAALDTEHLNHYKISLGIVLDEIQTLCHEAELQGWELGTFKQILAELHLSLPRVVDLIRNARLVLEDGIREENWRYLDSSVLKMFRKYKKMPSDYWDDILTLSYTDLEIKINELS